MVSFRRLDLWALPFLATLWLRLGAAQSTTPTPAELAAVGVQFETAQHSSPDLSWYETPANFSSNLKPGVVLKVEEATDITNYTVPGGLTLSRIIYTSLDVHGRVLPVSAYILWPYHALPENDTLGYDVALWAHGTSGLFPPCAPSNYRSLQYHFMVPYLLANQGLVVVATDYAGLGVGSFANGTQIRHPWATSPAQANDMAYALEAARSAFPQYLARDGSFVSIGHSEGGRNTWGFAERQAVSPVPGYRGIVLLSPAASPIDITLDALKNPDASWSIPGQTLALLTIASVTAVYPSYNFSGYTNVSAHIFDAYQSSGGCLPTQNILYGTTPPAEYAKANWSQAPEVEAWNNLTRVGNKRFAGPILLLAGNAKGTDGIIPFDLPLPSALVTTVDSLCDTMKSEGWEESIQMVGFDGATHFPVIQASESLWLEWIKQRLAGYALPPATGCSVEYSRAFRGAKETTQFLAPNFLLDWVNATESWQYSL